MSMLAQGEYAIEAQISPSDDLPALVLRAGNQLLNARGAAEVLAAKETAAAVYDIAKRAARFQKAKKAHDDVIAAVLRAQADALVIESMAKRRLADEYDAAQERGEIATVGKPVNVLDGNNKPTIEDIGLTRKQVHEARHIRDAEEAQPGVVRQILDARIANGQEPTRTAVREAVIEAAKLGLRGNGGGQASSRKNTSYAQDPRWDAMLAVSSGCRDMMDEVRDHSPEFIIGGFVDAAQRRRNLASIRECRDFLNKLLEYADAH